MKSEICIWRAEDGAIDTVLSVEGRVEAPNWHSDGCLFVNSDGRLWRVPLGEPRLELVPTGFAAKLNNDHALSPDGNFLALSDKTETEQSCIYIVPVDGGTPRRVTAATPSWLHGWSPEGDRLVYAAVREGGPVAIYLCDAESGDERLVVDSFDHADGPDFSADGRWIWFNGERDGTGAHLWRVRPDGTGLEQMTHGSEVDWFPHPSPDGGAVLFLRYPAGTEGHPADLSVSLMLMPQQGGVAREIASFRGGQGSINVPCWKPDGDAFAFIRYPQ